MVNNSESQIDEFIKVVKLEWLWNKLKISSDEVHMSYQDHDSSNDLPFEYLFTWQTEVCKTEQLNLLVRFENNISKIPIYVFLGSAIACMMWSTIFHMFLDHSKPMCDFLSKLDFAGISLLIWGSACAPIYYSLYWSQNGTMRTIYLGGMITLWTFGFWSMLIPYINSPTNKKGRALIFVTIGVSPIVWMIHFYGFRQPLTMPHFDPYFWLLGGGTYIFGAFVYAIKFPESWFPGRFDFWGHSHNLWHIFVLAAAFCHYLAVLGSYRARKDSMCPIIT